MVLLCAHCGHRVTDKGNVAPIFGCKGRPHNDWIDMDTVENDARCETFVGKGHANNTRFAGAHGGHCIEEVCNSTKPLVDGPYQSVGSRLAVTNCHANSARREGLHKSCLYAFWRQSHHGRSDGG